MDCDLRAIILQGSVLLGNTSCGRMEDVIDKCMDGVWRAMAMYEGNDLGGGNGSEA